MLLTLYTTGSAVPGSAVPYHFVPLTTTLNNPYWPLQKSDVM